MFNRVLGFPPLEDKSVPLQRPPLHPKSLAPEECRGFLPAAPQGPELCGTLFTGTRWPHQPGVASGTAPTGTGPAAAAVGSLWRGTAAGPAPAPHSGTRCGSRTLRHLPQGRAGTLRGGGCGGAAALTGTAGRGQRGAGVTGVLREQSGARRSRPRIALCPGGARNRVPRGGQGSLHQRATQGLQTSTKESSRMELIKEFQFPSMQPLVLCEHKTKPGHSHC